MVIALRDPASIAAPSTAFEERGTHRINCLSGDWTLYAPAVAPPPSIVSGLEGPSPGSAVALARDRELDTLMRGFEAAEAGTGAVISGEDSRSSPWRSPKSAFAAQASVVDVCLQIARFESPGVRLFTIQDALELQEIVTKLDERSSAALV